VTWTFTARFQGEDLQDGEEFQEIAGSGEVIRDGTPIVALSNTARSKLDRSANPPQNLYFT
jgi:hypothetical protein